MESPTSAADQQLYAAAAKGDTAQLLQIIARACPTAVHGPEDYTALHAAAEFGHLQVVQMLLLHGWALEARTTKGRTALHLAAQAGHMDVVQSLLGCGLPHGAVDSAGLTPMHVAASYGHTAVMEVLLQSGGSINAANNKGQAPIHLAAHNGQKAAVLLLLKAGAAADCASRNGSGWTPLHIAAWSGRLPVVGALLDAGAPVNTSDPRGCTPLSCACQTGQEQVVQELLRRGARASLQGHAGAMVRCAAAASGHVGVMRLLLHVPEMVVDVGTIQMACLEGHNEVVSLLLAHGAGMRAAGAAGAALLHAAVSHEHLAVVRTLLAVGADPGAVRPSGAAALHDAAKNGNLPIMQALLAAMAGSQRSAAMHACHAGLTPLHWAVEKGNTSCVEALVAAGADVDQLYGEAARDDAGASFAGATALHRAVQLGRAAAVPLLATPHNIRHVWAARTPLHMALAARDAVLAQVLLAAGSPAGVPDGDGDTALRMAARSNNAAIRILLPALVRSECAAHHHHQQQQQEGGQKDLAGVLYAVADGIFTLLIATAVADPPWFPEQATGVGCFTAVMEVLEPAAARDVLQQVLGTRLYWREKIPVANFDAQLLKVLHTGWLAALEPVLRVRWRWANRLQRLVTLPLLQQGTGSAAAGAQQQQQCLVADAAQLEAQIAAAARVLDWRLYVRLLEQLTGTQPDQASALLYAVADRQIRREILGVPGVCYQMTDCKPFLCEALLQAWLDGRQQAAGRAVREAADAVVSAVVAWQGSQCPKQPSPAC